MRDTTTSEKSIQLSDAISLIGAQQAVGTLVAKLQRAADASREVGAKKIGPTPQVKRNDKCAQPDLQPR